MFLYHLYTGKYKGKKTLLIYIVLCLFIGQLVELYIYRQLSLSGGEILPASAFLLSGVVCVVERRYEAYPLGFFVTAFSDADCLW